MSKSIGPVPSLGDNDTPQPNRREHQHPLDDFLCKLFEHQQVTVRPYLVWIRLPSGPFLTRYTAASLGSGAGIGRLSNATFGTFTSAPAVTSTNSSTTDPNIWYRRANLPTPTEAAMRDWLASRPAVLTTYLHERLEGIVSSSMQPTPPTTTTRQQQQHPRHVVWIQTILHAHHVQNQPRQQQQQQNQQQQQQQHAPLHNIHYISCTEDPFGWDQENGSPNMEHLTSIIDAIQQQIHSIQQSSIQEQTSTPSWTAFSPHSTTKPTSPTTQQQSSLASKHVTGGPSVLIVFESITPLLMRHGWRKTQCFVQSILKIFAVPVIVFSTKHNDFQSQSSKHWITSHASALILLDGMSDHTTGTTTAATIASTGVTPVLHTGWCPTILRRGFRQHDKFVRQSLPPFFIHVSPSPHTRRGGGAPPSSMTPSQQPRQVTTVVWGDAKMLTTLGSTASGELRQHVNIGESPSSSVPKPLSLTQHGGTTGGVTTITSVAPSASSTIQLQYNENHRIGPSHSISKQEAGWHPQRTAITNTMKSHPTVTLISDSAKQSTFAITHDPDDPEYNDYDDEEPDDDLDI